MISRGGGEEENQRQHPSFFYRRSESSGPLECFSRRIVVFAAKKVPSVFFVTFFRLDTPDRGDFSPFGLREANLRYARRTVVTVRISIRFEYKRLGRADENYENRDSFVHT